MKKIRNSKPDWEDVRYGLIEVDGRTIYDVVSRFEDVPPDWDYIVLFPNLTWEASDWTDAEGRHWIDSDRLAAVFRDMCAEIGDPDTVAGVCHIKKDELSAYMSGDAPIPAQVWEDVYMEALAAKEIISAHHRAIGKINSPAHTAARKKNMAKVNASYTPEKRKAAARKRLETLAKKKKKS